MRGSIDLNHILLSLALLFVSIRVYIDAPLCHKEGGGNFACWFITWIYFVPTVLLVCFMVQIYKCLA